MVGGEIIAPSHPTCKNRVIDFFVVSNSLAGMVVGAIAIGDALCRPHWPVRLYLKADVRTMAVRMLKKVGKLPAVLPMDLPGLMTTLVTSVSSIMISGVTSSSIGWRVRRSACLLLMKRPPNGLEEELADPSLCRGTPWKMSRVGPGRRLRYRELGVAKQDGSVTYKVLTVNWSGRLLC